MAKQTLSSAESASSRDLTKQEVSEVIREPRKRGRKRKGLETTSRNPDKETRPKPDDADSTGISGETNDVTGKHDVRSNVKHKRNRKSNTLTSMKSSWPSTPTKIIKEEARTTDVGRPLYLGAHVSMAGGLENAVYNATSIGANCFGLFLRSQRQWKSKPLEEAMVLSFKTACEEHGFPSESILPHGSYLLNLGSPDEETLAKSRDSFVDEMSRCQRLGISLYNFHPGSTCGKIPVEESLKRIASGINLALSRTEGVTAVIENMCCQGSTVGGKFEELRGIIDMVEDKSRVGVCLDTCHAFAAGNDLRTKEGYEKMMSDFDEKVGLEFLRAIHLNDSVGKIGCHLDRHENIGKGKIGLNAFRCLVNDPRLRGIPMILETPGK